MVTREDGISLTWHAYPGDRHGRHPIRGHGRRLETQYEAVCAAAGADADAADVTVVFDAGQNSEANFAHWPRPGWAGSGPSRHQTARTCAPACCRAAPSWTRDRFGGLTACDTRRAAYGAGRRAILTHSPELHAAQAAGFDGTTLAKAG